MRRTKAMKECYEKMKIQNPELVALAEEIKKSKDAIWVPHFVAHGVMRGLISSKDEVLNTIKGLSFGMDSYKKTLKNNESLLDDLEKFCKGDK